MWSEYPSVSGSVPGEIRNEIYSQYGQEIMETAIYGWDYVWVDKLTVKEYILINSSPRQFLIATVKFYPNLPGKLPKDAEIPNIPITPSFSPETIHFEWVATNIDFLPKYVLDERGIPYNL